MVIQPSSLSSFINGCRDQQARWLEWINSVIRFGSSIAGSYFDCSCGVPGSIRPSGLLFYIDFFFIILHIFANTYSLWSCFLPEEAGSVLFNSSKKWPTFSPLRSSSCFLPILGAGVVENGIFVWEVLLTDCSSRCSHLKALLSPCHDSVPVAEPGHFYTF